MKVSKNIVRRKQILDKSLPAELLQSTAVLQKEITAEGNVVIRS